MSSNRKKYHHKWWQRAIFSIGRPILRYHYKRKYGFYIKEPLKLDEPTLIMQNHVTDSDMFLMIAAVDEPMYFVGSEHLVRSGGLMKFFINAFDGIPLCKGSVAIGPTKEIVKRIKDGNHVCIFPEGSRTFDGRTNPFNPATGKLIKMSGAGLVTFRFKGGYFVQPRWTKVWRKGPLTGEFVGHYSADEIKRMSVEEINEILRRDIYEDAYETQLKDPKEYQAEGLAEGIENILYLCPSCHKLETIKGHGDDFTCSACGMKTHYDSYGMLSSDNEAMSFKTLAQWVDWEDSEFDRMYEQGEMSFENSDVTLSSIDMNTHVEKVLTSGSISADKEGMKIGEYEFPFNTMEGFEYINLGNSLLFTNKNVYYTAVGDYVGGYKYRRLYLKYKECMEKEKAGI